MRDIECKRMLDDREPQRNTDIIQRIDRIQAMRSRGKWHFVRSVVMRLTIPIFLICFYVFWNKVTIGVIVSLGVGFSLIIGTVFSLAGWEYQAIYLRQLQECDGMKQSQLREAEVLYLLGLGLFIFSSNLIQALGPKVAAFEIMMAIAGTVLMVWSSIKRQVFFHSLPDWFRRHWRERFFSLWMYWTLLVLMCGLRFASMNKNSG